MGHTTFQTDPTGWKATITKFLVRWLVLFLISTVFWGRQEAWLWDLERPGTVASWIAGTGAAALLWPWIYRQIRGLVHDLDQWFNH